MCDEIIIYLFFVIFNMFDEKQQEVAIFCCFIADFVDILIFSYYIRLGGYSMKISYKKLWLLLVEREISQADLRKDLNIASGTMTKMRRNEEVALSILIRICEYLDCNIGDICEVIKVDFI